MKKEFICIVCPRGCHVTVDDDGTISGNKCKRGEVYVKAEMTNPTRIVTSTVKTVFEDSPRVSVKTDKPVPKKLINAVMDELAKVEIDEQMYEGDIVIENILDTGANIILTRDCPY